MTRRAGNRVTLLAGGGHFFPDLIAALDRAEREIHLESYIFEPDETGLAVAEALVRAAARGVRVKVLLDGFGARTFPAPLAARLREAGVALMFFRPELGSWRLRMYRLRRMHRKLAVIDARVAYVGGINIIDDANTMPGAGKRHDYAVRVEGPLLADVYPAVRRLWLLVRWSAIGHRPHHSPPLAVAAGPAGDQVAEFLQRDNLRHRREIEEAYLDAIRAARREVLIANAYFLPGRRFRQALVEAARRGVRVTLVLQGRTDHRWFQLVERALYRYFLENGIEIYEFHASELHAKAAVVDGAWATVGSSNIDPFSLLLAREANVVVYERGFAETLHARVCEAMADGAHAIQRREWSHVPWHVRFASWALYGLVRLLMGWLGMARRL
ncbi:cardiolipin synthase ClsB [Parasulfuritortus cantonensis]|uniref:Cardiolipin synthase B n=1 Tax=Parasulfuritortus cantonensis TaxID=2528202 RepID=A0A4R1BFR0_9PROT|nr:cardiolipin synthase ClsB [Parasulfuritortus cantonensis]TCJ15983.1 cardiolipin synthase ClsB [Parasulfuritortus cantonensis]